VVATIRDKKPEMVFAVHVETAAGMLLPDAYIRALAEATHAAGGLFVLDCVASGAIWVDMAASGVDVLISAPQKGWSSSPCCALVMLSERARNAIDATTSTSFACDLRKWLQIMEAYEGGGHAYHATMPTDALNRLCKTMKETRDFGFEQARTGAAGAGRQGARDARAQRLQERRGAGFPGARRGRQLHRGCGHPVRQEIPRAGPADRRRRALQCDEPADFRTFRVGLFGLDKLANVDRTVANLEQALSRIAQ